MKTDRDTMIASMTIRASQIAVGCVEAGHPDEQNGLCRQCWPQMERLVKLTGETVRAITISAAPC